MAAREFFIDRKTWGRGDWYRFVPKDVDYGPIDSVLYEPQTERQCCLGQILEQCGVPKKVLENLSVPSELKKHKRKIPTELLGVSELGVDDSTVAMQMMKVNDNHDIADKDREKRLKKIAATINWKLTFVGRSK